MIDNTLLKWVNAEPIQPTEGSKMLSYSIKAKSGYSIDSMIDIIQILHSVKN